VSVVLSNRHKKYSFFCRLLKTADIKNEILFLVTVKIITLFFMTVEIISRHNKKILDVTLNRFSSSVLPYLLLMEDRLFSLSS
jgi:hypothetical protein